MVRSNGVHGTGGSSQARMGSLRLYRKSRLFDRLLSFDVQTRMPSGPLQ